LPGEAGFNPAVSCLARRSKTEDGIEILPVTAFTEDLEALLSA